MRTRNERINLRLSKEEKELLTMLAKKEGLTYIALIMKLARKSLKENGGK